jgi:hypothetical protein
MNLESRRVRRAFAAFGIAWNVTLPLLLIFSSGPLPGEGRIPPVRGVGRRQHDRLWSGKADPPGLRAWEYAAFFVASGLIFLGIFVFRF